MQVKNHCQRHLLILLFFTVFHSNFFQYQYLGFVSSFDTVFLCLCFFMILPFYTPLTCNSLCFRLCLISFKSKHSSPDSKSSTIINYSPSPAPNNLPADAAHFPGLERERKREEERKKTGEMDIERLRD